MYTCAESTVLLDNKVFSGSGSCHSSRVVLTKKFFLDSVLFLLSMANKNFR